MLLRLRKWGNSQGIRLPKKLLNQLKLKVDDRVKVVVVNEKIIILKVQPEKIDIQRLFDDYNGDYKGEEFDWGSVTGEEIW